MLSRAGFDTPTGGASEVARLLANHGWAASTWRNRSSQIKKWLIFCDEDDRCPLPATEGDVLAYIGFLSLEGRLASVSVPHYITAISRYHELHHLSTPTKTPMIRSALAAYARKHDATRSFAPIRIGCPASLVRRIVACGISESSVEDVGYAATVIFGYLFHCRATSIRRVLPEDLMFTSTYLRVRMRKRKGKALNRPLLLDFPRSPTWGTDNPIALLEKWSHIRPDSPGFFDIRPARFAGTADLGMALLRCLLRLRANAPSGCYYGSHSPRIGSFNELFHLRLPREMIMRRFDWANTGMFIVYTDGKITTTPDSRWFFGHLLHT